MSIEFVERKQHTIELLHKLEDETKLFLIEQVLSEADEDWAIHLSDQERADIQEGLHDLEAGRTEDYESFTQRMQHKFS